MSEAQQKRRSLEQMLKYAKNYDSMYREGLDGFIGVKLLPIDRDSGKQQLEMITILDMASIYAEKHDLAKKEAMKLLKL